MKYIARVVLFGGLTKTVKFPTMGKAMEYVIYWWESGFPVAYVDIIKCMHNGITRRVFNIYAGA